ncbi:cytochrome P450 [Streptomyces himalayensis]|uniref:Cytochrome P450 n=1 Tax=Streptomyces himalayensis subsp. himalayensis TaxID=2756131 RepID=A0A7W0DLD1_9ACTN|nr:cytochrome P450 [Streptomyces himalayensis]MBA2946753.1 cytochrome P450 [Streptomyces himalayensis subsp. himalayensis]
MEDITQAHNPALPEFWLQKDPDSAFADMRHEKAVHWHDEPASDWFPEGGRGFWSVVRYEDVVEVSRDQETFTSENGTEIVDMTPEMVHIFGGMLNMSGAAHAHHRAIVNRVLTPRTVEALSDTIRVHARRCIDRVADRGSCDFMQDIVGDFPAQIICELLGVPVDDRDRLVALTGTALSAYGTAEAYNAVLEIIAYAEQLVAQARAQVSDSASFLRKLLSAQVDGERMSDHEIAVFFALLVTAGIETTATSIGQGMYALSLYPEQRRRWQEDFQQLAPRAVEEIVRWVTPVRYFRRTATRDAEIAGQPIAKGDKVVMWYTSANRDESVIDRAWELDFSRAEDRHVAFGGGGPHFCLGAVLARKEMTIFFDELFTRLPDIEVCGEPERLHSNFVNGLAALPVRYTPA